MNTKQRLFSVLSVVLITVAACGDDDAATADYSVVEPWARATVEAQPHGAVYFDLTVGADDTLVGATVSSDVADHAEIHEVVEADTADDEMDTGESDTAELDDEMDMGESDTAELDAEMDMGESDTGDEMDMGGGDGDHGGMAPGMIMREVDGGIDLPADETITFEPGGYHVMLLDLVEPLEVGAEFELTLEFAELGDVTIPVPILETAP